MNILRRLSLSRLLLLCGVVVTVGIGATALALAVGTGPTPPSKPLADAVHDALSAPKISGVSARIQFTNHLLEGANLASGNGEAGQITSSPLLTGAAGRLWIGSNGQARLELQSEQGDTQILWDGKTAELYDASANTLYRYTPQQADAPTTASNSAPGSACPPTCSSGASNDAGSGYPSGGSTRSSTGVGLRGIPTVGEIEESLTEAGKHANISPATPTDVAGQAAYTVRVSPRENGGLIGGVELSWDAASGVPLRTALYSINSSTPVIELSATEISYGPVESSILDFTPPANAKVVEVTPPRQHDSGTSGSSTAGEKPQVSSSGKGLGSIVLLESPIKTAGAKESMSSELEALPKVNINGTSASELPTQLGTLLTFERAGVRYLLAGSVTPASIEAFARGL